MSADASWSRRALVPAIGVAVSALVLFGFQLPGWGHLLLAASVALAGWMDRELGVDLPLIGGGIAQLP